MEIYICLIHTEHSNKCQEFEAKLYAGINEVEVIGKITQELISLNKKLVNLKISHVKKEDIKKHIT